MTIGRSAAFILYPLTYAVIVPETGYLAKSLFTLNSVNPCVSLFTPYFIKIGIKQEEKQYSVFKKRSGKFGKYHYLYLLPKPRHYPLGPP